MSRWRTLSSGLSVIGLIAMACGGAAAPTATPTKSAATPVATAAPGGATATPTRAAAVSTPTPTVAGPAPTASSSGPRGKMTMAAVADITNRDIHVATGGGLQSFYTNTDFNATLLSIQREGKPAEPYLTESWSWDEKGLKIRFVIRKGARFHDGKAVTSDDILFTVEKIRSPYARNSPNSALPRQIKTVEAIDDRTVVFTLPGADALGWSKMGGLVIQPRHSPYEAFQQNPIGAGPYKFVEWRPFESLTMEASPYWWDADKVQVKTIVRMVVPEPESRLAMLKAGQIDFMDEVQPRQGEELLKDKRFRVRVTNTGGWVPVLFSTDTPVIPGTDVPNPFLDVRVRRAFILAVDRKAIFDGVALGKYGIYIPGPWSRNVVGVGAAVEGQIKPYDYDPKEARRLLDEAKFPFDREFPIWYYRSSSGYPEAYQVAIAYWNAIGIKARDRLTEVGTIVSYAGDSPARTYPIRMYRVNGLSAEGEAPGYVTFSKNTPEGFNGQMLDPKLEAWALQMRTTFEPAEREKINREIYLYLHEQALTIPLLGGVLIFGFNQRVDWDIVPGQTTVTHLWRTTWMPGAP